MRKIIQIFSYIFHPVIIPVMATGCYFFVSHQFYSTSEIQLTLFHTLLLTFLLPICIYFMLRSMKMMSSSIMIERREERTSPIVLNIALLAILVFYIWENNRIYNIKHFFIGYMLSYLIVLATVLFKKKYSIHMLSYAALSIFFIKTTVDLYKEPLFAISALIFIGGCIASARLAINAHTSKEIVIGTFIGALPQIILWNKVFIL